MKAFLLSLLLLSFFCSVCLAEQSPTQALVQEQLWDLSHILVWTIVGGIFVTLLLVCAAFFACCNYFCVARRRDPVTAYIGSADAVYRKRRNASLSIIVITMLLVIVLGVVLAFNALLLSYVGYVTSPPVQFSNQIASTMEFQNICEPMSGIAEIKEIHTECTNLREHLSHFKNMVQNGMNQFEGGVSQLVLTMNVLAGALLVLVVLAAVGACKQSSLAVRIFTVFALFFASAFCLFWLIFGMPSALVLHNCQMVHSAFNHNNSEAFPGIQLLAFVYNETNEFSDFDQFEQRLQNHEVKLKHINFTALLPEQERLFTALRSCAWEGQTLTSALEIVHLHKPLVSMLTLSQNIVSRINYNLRNTHYQLPANVTKGVQQIEWGTHGVDGNTSQLLLNMMVDVQSFSLQLQSEWGNKNQNELNNVTGDCQILITQLNALNAFIYVTDCQYVKETYNDLNVNFCRAFLGTSNMIAWLLTLLTTVTVLAFFVTFYAGHRVFSRPLPVSTTPHDAERGGKSVNQDVNAPLLSSAVGGAGEEKQYYATGPVSYNPPPPVYNSFDANTRFEKL